MLRDLMYSNPLNYCVSLAQPMSMRFIIRGSKPALLTPPKPCGWGATKSYCGPRTHHLNEGKSHMSFLYSSVLPMAILMTAALVPLLSAHLGLNFAQRLFKPLSRREDPVSISLVHRDCRAGSGVHNPDQRHVLAVAPFRVESRYRECLPVYVPYS